MRIVLLCTFLLSAIYPAAAQESTTPAPSRVATAVREYRQGNEHRIVRELNEFLSIPNNASDTPNILRNAERLKAMLEARGFRVQFLPIAGRGPAVYAELPTPGATRTVIFYAHYDGQPTDASRWTGTKPWEPALRTKSLDAGGTLISFPAEGTPYQDDWRIYARSASDDKSPIVALLAALDALRAKKIPLGVNLKLILDGEEEAGSPNLPKVLAEHRERFRGDVLLTIDGPVHQSGRPLLFFGNRGVTDMNITVYGPTRPLHSGHYGNWAPNPAFHLARLLASMKDADGRVLVEGFYDDVAPLSDREKQALAELPANDADLMRELHFAKAEGGGKKLVELINMPSLNIRGIQSAYVGAQSQNIVPTKAEASLDLRLVKNIDPAEQVERVIAHIRKQGFYVTRKEPTNEEREKYPFIVRVTSNQGYPAARTSMDLPVSRAVVRVVEEAVGAPVVKMPTLGGSAPMYLFENMQLPVIGVPIVNHDNNQHSENENLRVGNFWRGMEIFGAILADLKW
ncbi:MAG TPA: M20/M25/M40 family metallo-hydrolase [Candidatus Acidoferrales bacterium]|nr:M20/M25/M40 family metallo-hydrolase [Candidatus Acidoferrales bacterium]